MYPLRPENVYVLEHAQSRKPWADRVRRILGAIDYPVDRVVPVTEQNAPQVVAEIQDIWPPEGTAGHDVPHRRPLVFTTMQLDGAGPDLEALLERCPDGTPVSLLKKLFGRFQKIRPTHPREVDAERDQVCWPTLDFGAMRGCPHGCLYCGEGNGGSCIAVAVNLEEYVEQVVGPTIEENPWQMCFRMIGWGSDLIAFEPENGLFDLFTRKLAEYEGRYGYFHTASDNVDWVADLPRRDRLIGVWSLTCHEVAQGIEKGSGPAAERVEAARRCQEAGLPVRFKFKPIIPVRGWREGYARIIETALTRARPESVGMCVLMWMDFEALTENIPPDMLDPDCVAAAEAAADELAGVRTGPFPHANRAEIYRFFVEQVRRRDADVPLYVSTESREMWDELADELGQDPDSYVCGCSSVALPGGRLALSEGCPHSTYSPLETDPS